MGKRREDRELHWRSVLERQAESGLSVAKFCRQESISAPSFYTWRRKLRERGRTSQEEPGRSGGQAEVHLLPVRVESAAPSSPVRVLLPQGVSLDVPSDVNRSVLTELLRALRESTAC